MTDLEKKVIEYQRAGWILLNSNGKTAQLKKPKRGFSCLPNILFTILAVAGLVTYGQNDWTPGVILFIIGIAAPFVYMIGFALQRERLIVLVEDNGEVKASARTV